MDDGRPAAVPAAPPVLRSAGATAEEVAARLTRAFAEIANTRMADVPFCNSALQVESVGFRSWDGRWLGVLITPWCMNLMLLPQDPAAWRHVRYGDSQGYALPAGVFEFISAREPLVGDYQSCSLFSPMFEFGDQEGARLTALAALDALFAKETRAGVEGPGTPLGPIIDLKAEAPAPQRATVSKRDFLRGRWRAEADEA
ncbi:MAG: [NiFe]-hydrogenase assembly chaperone HybE [Betaproteobacteria bacterium]|jgi:[NiFe] hydrogenase assembly HybE family chaperone